MFATHTMTYGSALKHKVPSARPSCRADLDDVVSRANHTGLVLYHQHMVPLVS